MPSSPPWLALCLGLVLGCSDADEAGASGEAGSGGTSGSKPGGASGSKNGGASGSKSGGASQGGSTSAPGGRPSTAGGGTTGAGAGNPSMAAGGTTSAGGAGDEYGDARVRCVERTNELRASIGRGPIPRLASAEPCVDGQAKSDSETGEAHGAFEACLDEVKGWKGVGQNECPGYGSVESALGTCLDMMWAEGPGGGHYDNMVGDSTHMACGFYTTPSGKVWMVQDFWTE